MANSNNDNHNISSIIRKRSLTEARVKKKRRLDKEKYDEVTIISNPEKYLPYDTLPDTVARTLLEYFQQLQQNECPGPPHNWWEILERLPRKQKSQGAIIHHPWKSIQSNHYQLALTSNELKNQLDLGLHLPVFIPLHCQLGQEIYVQSPWPKKPLKDLLDRIFRHQDNSIFVQDHNLSNIGVFTIEKTCKEVKTRFQMDIKERGEAWNCLEVKDCLPGNKGPPILSNGGRLLDWQFTNPSSVSMDRPKFEPLEGSKQIHKWLLVSEAKSSSTAHVDVGYATWVSCLAGKKTFWVRNPSMIDHRQWMDLDINDDHSFFNEPWGRIDLLPGSTL